MRIYAFNKKKKSNFEKTNKKFAETPTFLANKISNRLQRKYTLQSSIENFTF